MRTPRLVAPLALCLAVFAADAARADRLDASLTLGGAASASVSTAGTATTIGFLVSAGPGRNLAFSVKRAKGSKLTPDVRLVAPDGHEWVITEHGGSVKAGATSWSAKLPDVPQSGLWRLEVRGRDGTTGAFSALVKGKDAFKQSGTLLIPAGGKQEIAFDAGDGAALTFSASRAGSEVITQLTILDSSGATLPGGPFIADAKTGKLSLKKFPLPFFGRYTLKLTGAKGTGGNIKYSVSGAFAKPSAAAPTADAGPAVEAEPEMLTTLDGSHSQPASGKTLSYRWSQLSGTPVALMNASTSRPSFVAPSDEGSLLFQLSVVEEGVRSRPATLDLMVARRPVSDAGRTQVVASAATVTLDGSASFDRRGKGLRYSWRQVPGDDIAVTLADPGAARPTFKAPAGNHTLHFGLTVDDGNARGFEDVVVVEVGTANASAADAGREQYVPRMATVHLSGLASRNASGVLDTGFAWTQTSGPAVTLSGATTPWPSFTAPRGVADLEFKLTMNGVAATADRVSVHVRATETNLPAPTDAVGPLNAASGAVQLGSALTTDPDGDALAFRWAQIAGPAAPLTDAAAAQPSVTLGAATGLVLFGVQSNDGLQYGAPDVVSVRNTSFAGLPLAIAGTSRTTTPGVAVTLDGSGSARTDGGSAPLTYHWTQVSGQDWFDATTSLVAFDPSAAKPSLALPTDISSLTTTRTVVFQLVVDDGTAQSRPDFAAVTFTGLKHNGRPTVTVTPSDLNPIVGTNVRLDATAVDREGDALTYRWSQTSGPAMTLMPSATSLSVSFVAGDSAVPVTFRLIANDGFEDSDPAAGTVIVDRRPVASAVVAPIAGNTGTPVTMDATSSADPEGNDVTYRWTQFTGPTVTIADPTAAVISFTAPSAAVGFRLVVNDGRQDSDPRLALFSNVPPPTAAPTADRTNAPYGATVSLSANPGAGGPYSYVWRQINPFGNDPTCTILGPTSNVAQFVVPLPTATPFGQSPRATFGLIVGNGLQFSSEYTVSVTFFASLDNSAQTSNTVYSIVTNNCVSCHSGTLNSCPVGSGTSAIGYGMGTKAAFLQNSRAVLSCATTSGGPVPTPVKGGKQRLPAAGVTGASGTTSYLFDRIKVGGATPRMPSSGNYLTTTEINLIQDWIDQGVQDN